MTEVKFDDNLKPTLESLLRLQDSDEYYEIEMLVAYPGLEDSWTQAYYLFPSQDSALRYVEKNYSKDRIKAVRTRLCKVAEVYPFPEGSFDMLVTNYQKEYDCIARFYGDRKAQRSQVPLINHIDEGLAILDFICASPLAKGAFCLHPIVQNSENVDVTWSPCLSLAVEYKLYANSYLCRPETDWIKTAEDLYAHIGNSMSIDCRKMLVADKLQNQKDFLLWHYGKHPRSKELDNYFKVWLHYLMGL